MRHGLLGGVASILLLGVTGCGGSASGASDSAAACTFTTPLPEEAAKPTALHPSVEQQARSQGLAALDTYLRPYLRGEIVVYRGTLEAHDNQGVLGTQSGGYYGTVTRLKDQSVPTSTAVASLTIKTGQTGSAVLTVHSLPERKYLTFQQTIPDASQTTDIGIILSDEDTGGNSGPCAHCVPSLAGGPSSIVFDHVESTQLVGRTNGGGATLHTYATASLERVRPCDVTFADVAELNKPASIAFEARGDEMVSELTGYGFSPTGCFEDFKIEIYVNLANLSDYGVRNFKATNDCAP